MPTAAPSLTVVEIDREVVVLGAFQRAASAVRLPSDRGVELVRRRSGGPAVIAGAGTLHVTLALPRPDAFVPCTPAQILNRHVRPLLAGLGRVGAKASYFGRDTVSVAHRSTEHGRSNRPIAWVGFAHESATGATWLEAFVAVTHDFALPRELDGYGARARDPLSGKAPGTLAQIMTGRTPSARAVADAIVDAYRAAYGEALAHVAPDEGSLSPAGDDDRPPWDATIEESIGFVGAGRDPVEIGGDFFASAEVVRALSEALGDAPCTLEEARSAVGRARDLGVLEGVRDLDSIARLLLR